MKIIKNNIPSLAAVYKHENGLIKPDRKWFRFGITGEIINDEFKIVPTIVKIDNSKYTFIEISSTNEEILDIFEGELLKHFIKFINITN